MQYETKVFWTRLLSIILAVLFMLYGCLGIIMGVVVEVVLADHSSIITYSSASLGIVITLGIGMFALGVLGLKALYAENKFLLKLDIGLSLLTVLVELLAGILCFVYAESAARHVAMGLHFNVSSYGVEDSTSISRSVDMLQKEFECCGYNNFLEWNNNPAFACQSNPHQSNLHGSDSHSCQLPDSCCAIQVHLSCLYVPGPVDGNSSQILYRGNAYETGCMFAFMKWLEVKVDIIGIISLAAVALQVVCWLALCWYVLQMDLRSSAYILKHPTSQHDTH